MDNTAGDMGYEVAAAMIGNGLCRGDLGEMQLHGGAAVCLPSQLRRLLNRIPPRSKETANIVDNLTLLVAQLKSRGGIRHSENRPLKLFLQKKS